MTHLLIFGSSYICIYRLVILCFYFSTSHIVFLELLFVSKFKTSYIYVRSFKWWKYLMGHSFSFYFQAIYMQSQIVQNTYCHVIVILNEIWILLLKKFVLLLVIKSPKRVLKTQFS